MHVLVRLFFCGWGRVPVWMFFTRILLISVFAYLVLNYSSKIFDLHFLSNVVTDTSHIYGLQKNVTFPKVRVDDDVAGSMTSRLSSADVMTLKASSSLQKLTIPISNKTFEGSFPWKPVKVDDVDCSKLFADDKAEINRAWVIQRNQALPEISAEKFRLFQQNCSHFTQSFGFIMSPLTLEEERFPIAYSILTYKTPVQVLHLLRAIYRPQNYYCIHVDSKSDPQFREVITTITYCLNNVFLSSRSVDVKWGTFTVLEPELICMEDLWKYKAWKYFINLTGQEFPLKTNLEIVRILTAYRGANDVSASVKRANIGRWASAGPPPHNLNLTKGAVHVVVNRHFVDFILHDQIAHDFLHWCRNTSVPDETFFSTLNHNPHLGIPGSYMGEPEINPITKPFMARFKVWADNTFNMSCKLKHYVHAICIFSLNDLPVLKMRPELFANKFFQDYSRFAIDCLAEELHNRTRDQFMGKIDFNASSYGRLPLVTKMLTM